MDYPNIFLIFATTLIQFLLTMKKRTLFIPILCLCISYFLYQKANATQYLKVITDLTLENVESMANNELSNGDCESRLVDTWTEYLATSGTFAIVHEYKCFMSDGGTCFQGKIYDYYTSTSVIIGSEPKGSTLMCI